MFIYFNITKLFKNNTLWCLGTFSYSFIFKLLWPYVIYRWCFTLFMVVSCTLQIFLWYFFVTFKAQVKNLFNTKIKIFRSNRGGEFKSNTFKHLLSLHGIMYYFFCPHIPKWNGVIKKKKCYIVEIRLTLFAHAYFSPQFWLKVFFYYNIFNRWMPIIFHLKISPYDKFFLRNSPNYSHIWAFGCLWLHWLQPHKSNKLEFWYTKCYFLRYDTVHEGYRFDLVKEKNKCHVMSFFVNMFLFSCQIIILICFSKPHFYSWLNFYAVTSTSHTY